MTDKTHRLSYSKADWDLINARQELKWAAMASDVIVTKPDGTTKIIKNTVKPINAKKIKKESKHKRQQMFEGDI
jgi:hypothetical protein